MTLEDQILKVMKKEAQPLNAGKIADMLVAAGELVKQRRLAAVLIAREGDGYIHTAARLIRIILASSPRIVSA